MSGNDVVEVVGAVGLFTLVISVILTLVTQYGKTVRAKAALAREDEYRKLAEASASGLDTLRALDDRLTEMQARLKSIERVLEQVE